MTIPASSRTEPSGCEGIRPAPRGDRTDVRPGRGGRRRGRPAGLVVASLLAAWVCAACAPARGTGSDGAGADELGSMAESGRAGGGEGVRALLRRENAVYGEWPGVHPSQLAMDIYAAPGATNAPVLFMIHGGAWRHGDKTNPGIATGKPEFFAGRGWVYVAVNYRLAPDVRHPTQVKEIAAAIAWVRRNIRDEGGDPKRIFLMGHSSGAQLAALVATDGRRLEAEGESLEAVRGVVLLDGSGYDVVGMIRREDPLNLNIRRWYIDAFTDDPEVQRDASAVAHVAAGKGIPPFLIFCLADRPSSRREAGALADALRAAGVDAALVPAERKTHIALNRDIGAPGDAPTAILVKFLDRLAGPPRPVRIQRPPTVPPAAPQPATP